MKKYIVVDEMDFSFRSWLSARPFVYTDLLEAKSACNTSQCVLSVDVVEHSKLYFNEDK